MDLFMNSFLDFFINFFVMILRPDCVPLSRKSEENSLTKTSVMTRKRRSNATIVPSNAKVVLSNVNVSFICATLLIYGQCDRFQSKNDFDHSKEMWNLTAFDWLT